MQSEMTFQNIIFMSLFAVLVIVLFARIIRHAELYIYIYIYIINISCNDGKCATIVQEYWYFQLCHNIYCGYSMTILWALLKLFTVKLVVLFSCPESYTASTHIACSLYWKSMYLKSYWSITSLHLFWLWI